MILPRPCHGQGSAASRGVALVLVLWFLALIAVLAAGFAFVSRTETLLARNYVAAVQARMLAEAGVERATYELLKPDSDARRWKFDGRPQVWEFEGVPVHIVIRDESARLDLNKAPEVLILGLLKQLGLRDGEAARLADAIADWRDPDDYKRASGAEMRDYESAGLKHKPANGPFETLDELRLVMGMTPELFQRLRGQFTVYSRIAGFNSVSASPELLRSLPGVDPRAVAQYLDRRAQDWAEDRVVAPFPPALPYWVGYPAAYNLVAQAEMPDGTIFARESSLKLAYPILPRVLIRYTWIEADRMASTLTTKAASDPLDR